MHFTIQREIFTFFPGLKIAVAVARGVDNCTDRPGVAALWDRAWAAAKDAAVYGNAQSHPRVKPWRERLQAMGVPAKQFPSSIEAILRRALKGGAPFHINPLVDFYNSVSLTHFVPAGGFDLGALHSLELRLTQTGDHFTALDAAEAEAVPVGEVAYADGPTVLTRHFVWRQARTGLIQRETKDVILISEVLGEVGAGVADAVLQDFRTGLEQYFGVSTSTFLLDKDNLELVVIEAGLQAGDAVIKKPGLEGLKAGKRVRASGRRG